MNYNTKWLFISTFLQGVETTSSYLFNITPKQEELFNIFLESLNKHNGYYPCGVAEKERITDTLDCKDLYPEVFKNKELLEYLDLIGDYFLSPKGGFDRLKIEFNDKVYGYNGN